MFECSKKVKCQAPNLPHDPKPEYAWVLLVLWYMWPFNVSARTQPEPEVALPRSLSAHSVRAVQSSGTAEWPSGTLSVSHVSGCFQVCASGLVTMTSALVC
jgi:hypothetical protein